MVGSGENESLVRDGPDMKLAGDPALMLGRIHDQVPGRITLPNNSPNKPQTDTEYLAKYPTGY